MTESWERQWARARLRALRATMRELHRHHLIAWRRDRSWAVHAGGVETAARFALDRPDTGDHALRLDVLTALLRRARDTAEAGSVPLVWLARDGGPGVEDIDLAWRAATVQACAEHDLPATFCVLTPAGWAVLAADALGSDVGWDRLDQRGLHHAAEPVLRGLRQAA